LLDEIKAEARQAVSDIRRIAYGLRPPSLDELGLVGALREHAARMSAPDGAGSGIAVAVESLEPLPAAVEVAAYRIAAEALTNVARHADAANARVRICLNGLLEVEVSDDGRGLRSGSDPAPGIGLVSMRERAEELGGELLVGQGGGGRGTVVRARLPLDP
jgi:two-component system, NarL family, sensor kinase